MKNIKIYKLLALSGLLILSLNIASAATTFTNPLCPDPTNARTCADTIGEVIAKIVGSLYIFAIPIASIFILWGAFQFLTSQGEMEKIKKAKRTIFYAIAGLILMIFASGIGYVITDILGGGSSTQTPRTCQPGYYWNSTRNQCERVP